MLYVDELLMLTIGIVLIIFVYINLDRFKKIPQYKILFSSYAVVLTGWMFTVLEGFFLPQIINTLEHTCYMISSALLLYWVMKILQNKKA